MRAPTLTGPARWDAFNRMQGIVLAEMGPVPVLGTELCGICRRRVEEGTPMAGWCPGPLCSAAQVTIMHEDCYRGRMRAASDEAWSRIEAALAAGVAA